MNFITKGIMMIALMASSTFGAKATGLTTFFEEADDFFSEYVANGRVNYSELNTDKKELHHVVGLMGDASLDGASASEKKAFYINAYNISMIKAIIDHYPINSPLDVNGIFTTEKHKVAGEMLTLEQIEKQKLMPVYRDARLHFVLVCGAKGCPQLASFAYLPEKLENQIESQTRKALNSSSFIQVDQVSKTVKVSEIFKWYKDDFTKGGSTILAYINKYRNTAIPGGYKLDYYTYDWKVNSQ